MVACVRGDGQKLPIFWIDHQREKKNPDGTTQKAIKGMNVQIMSEWCDWVKAEIPPGSLLIMDQLSSHKNADILDQLAENGITVRLIPPKGSLILSPLDNGFFAVFKRKLAQEMERHPVGFGSLHFKAAVNAYNSISSVSVVNFFNRCGLIGSESFSTIRETFQKQIQVLNTVETRQFLEMFEKWAVGDLDIDGVKTPRLYQEEPPNLYVDDEMDGVYWSTWGQWTSPRCNNKN
jgi:hypothetical protein